MPDKLINLTIANKPVQVTEGKTVLEAAQAAGVYIPTLCYHPCLKPSGSCRLCIVEIEKMRGLPTSCTTPAAEGMVVHTETPQLQELRRGVLELILTEHPHACLTCERRTRCGPLDVCLRNCVVTERCVTCPKNRQCELQDLADHIGISEVNLPYRYKGLPVDGKEPLIARDYNLCVLCGRCVQMCQDVRGIGAISLVNRGSATCVGTAFGRPLAESGCRFCGACVEVCPVGALMDKEALLHPGLEREAVAVPCRHSCPAHVNIPLYVDLIARGKYQDALAVNREKIPFPGTLGRVCIHPCEQACRRGELNEPVAIKSLKRFIADRDTGQWRTRSLVKPATGKRVAVVGSGPAGLTAAYYLAKQGHSVTVFEALPKAGGMMRVGIPDYRLPKNVLESEINEIERVGVTIRLNSKVDTLDSLFQQGFDAVFLAVGAHRGSKLGIEGESIPGVMDGAAFLRDVALGNKVVVGEKVAVIGGGNVAIDSARTALRLGAKKISIIYRRTRDEMPASAEEIEGAVEEGIDLMFLAAPVKISRKDGRLEAVLQRMQLGEADASGRRRPEPVKDSEFAMEYDAIIGAVGQVPEVPAGFGVKTARGNTIQTSKSLATSREKVWAGGDAVSGPASVIEAIAAARRAASEIDKYLGGAGNIEEQLTTEREPALCVGKDEEFAARSRALMPMLPPEKRAGFVEVETGFTEEQAVAEAKRCCGCGVRLHILGAPRAPKKVAAVR